jgi:vacuolar-type H+-ATPase subunit H
MDDSILTDIIVVEKEVRDHLDAERERAAAQLEQVRNDLEKEYRREEERLQEVLEAALAAARDEAEQKAALLVQEAAERGERLARIGRDALQSIVVEHLAGLMPGTGDDR